MILVLDASLLRDLREHAEQRYPEECAGLLLGSVERDRRMATSIRLLENSSVPETRRRRYLIPAAEMLRAEQEAEAAGIEILGVFHSHPDHPAAPSEFDREHALPWYVYLIIRVQAGNAMESRAWKLNEDRLQMSELPLMVEPSDHAEVLR